MPLRWKPPCLNLREAAFSDLRSYSLIKIEGRNYAVVEGWDKEGEGSKFDVGADLATRLRRKKSGSEEPLQANVNM